jgi:hypothetical protein
VQFQLILQFRGDALADYDALVTLEGDLAAVLGDSADVDGHDCGSGESNIFMTTSDRVAAFQKVTPVLERTGRLRGVTAACRQVRGDRYTVLWPDSQREFTVA